MTSTRISAYAIMNQNTNISHEVGMAIFNLKVVDFDRFIKFKKIYALDYYSIPVLSVKNITWYKFGSIYPTASLNLERMCFCTL